MLKKKMKPKNYRHVDISPKKINKGSYIALAGTIASIGLAGYLMFSPFEKKASAGRPGYIIYDNNFMKEEKVCNSKKLENVVKDTVALKDIIQEMKQNKEKSMGILYNNFPRPEEILDIMKHAEMVGVESELLMAIRVSENGKDHIAYGVIPNTKYDKDKGYMKNGIFHSYQNEKEKQLRWAAHTIRSYSNRFKKTKNFKNKDFISYMARGYAPIGAKNDPHGLNKDWEPNVKKYYKMFKQNHLIKKLSICFLASSLFF
jgi:adenylate kinase family enzyme